jgi:hypothetical protein
VANGMRGFVHELINRVEGDGAWWGEEARALAGGRASGR